MTDTRSKFEVFLDDCDEAEEKYKAGETFIPTTIIEPMIAPEYISGILEGECENHQRLNERIHDQTRPAKIIFLIVARSGNLGILDKFLSGNFSDFDLPIEVERDRLECKVRTVRNGNLTKDLFGNMKWNDAQAFRDNQWPFLSPIFKDRFEFELKRGIPLPLVERGHSIISGFSTVCWVKMHPDHIPKIKMERLAMKKMDFGSEDEIKFTNKELKNLIRIRELEHLHLVRPVLTCTRGEDLETPDPSKRNEAFFFFPWADAGDLDSFWKKSSNENGSHIPWMLGQMVGLCCALELLRDVNCRHGDLKPANILCFAGKSGNPVLKITDVGLSKFHILATSKRLKGTTARTTTKRYIPPEFDIYLRDIESSQGRSEDIELSREFDIWSLGCIFIEFLIWVKLGQDEYKKYDSVMSDDRRFWDSERRTLNATVKERIKSLEAATAGDDLHKLLDLIQESMLVPKEERENAFLIRKKLEVIRDVYGESSSPPEETRLPLDLTGEQDLQQNHPQHSLETPKESEGADLGDVAPPPNPSELNTMAIPPNNAAAQNQSAKLQDRWAVTIDNGFARKLFSHSALAPPRENSQLCNECSAIRFWEPNVEFSGSVKGFLSRSSSCALCNLLYVVSRKLGLGEDQELRFVRNGPTLNSIVAHNQPVLSLFSDPGYNTNDLGFAQVGYPALPLPESPQRYRLFKSWIHTCDNEHGHAPEVCDTVRMPTRLIYVGEFTERLEEIKDARFQRYLALSHCWGGAPSLRTLTNNIEEFRKEIPHDHLPLNFQEAIRVTRGLKIPYLWIDSLCIIQDDYKDWQQEASRMGQVFSNAYCTIAATSAATSNEGFITPKTDPAPSVAIRTPYGGLLHISEFLEDLHQDLELARLNTRGWVMQERALSRRTLHFTKTQVYWECGNGVHCERLLKLSNPQSSLFEDSDFPRSILKYYKGGRITLFQNLYQKYSRLNFSRISDRPVAILGLEKRLSAVLETRGVFGIFEQYLARSLLWSRPEEAFLTHISFADGIVVPSWSWMAYEGPITYANIPFNRVEWSNECVLSSGGETDANAEWPVLKVVARDLTLQKLDMLNKVKLDEKSGGDLSSLRGVVLGKDKDKELRDQLHYVLLITQSKDQRGGKTAYVRAGVAWLLHHNIGSGGEEIDIY
ncbi:hypothetical protein F53441_8807 [Fusarium austroafricanum]|uniref:Protein kinase domain-containing protein n=1 Tax=Fusarium austroafricanum TaxID=2364996 RepID=A0A8H4NWZ9_9HYPO|nr:hypothetical protein F53441_8807 [Fusarium austroafricanum]